MFNRRPLTTVTLAGWIAPVLIAFHRAYSGEDDRLFRRNVTGDSGEVAL